MALSLRERKFRTDILEHDATHMIRRHLAHGDCFALSEDVFFELKSDVASHFKIHPTNVIMVGSGKLGFSIAPKKRFRRFRDDSDIDLAIVSEALFSKMWSEVFAYSQSGADWPESYEFKKYLFRGWIRPDKLPPGQAFRLAEDWWEFFRVLTNSPKYGRRRIRAGLYKDWQFLEDYQRKTFENCALSLNQV